MNLDGSAIVRGATETEQGFRVELCGFEEVVLAPEVEDAELVVMVPDTTEVPQAAALLMDAQVSAGAGTFRAPSVTQ